MVTLIWVNIGWRHQAITWINVDLSSVRFSGIHLRSILQEITQSSVTEISLKITYLKFCSNLPGANELNCPEAFKVGQGMPSLNFHSLTASDTVPHQHPYRLKKSTRFVHSFVYLNQRQFTVKPVSDKQRVLMHRHQGLNVRHGLCHIYMRYLYIYELFIAFVCFVVCSLL